MWIDFKVNINQWKEAEIISYNKSTNLIKIHVNGTS